jgi:SAM-dependent methyltransferase
VDSTIDRLKYNHSTHLSGKKRRKPIMQTLYVASSAELHAVVAFDAAMEPLLQRLEEAGRAGHPIAQSRLCQDYLQVCRWPFRRLEYSYALEALATTPGPAGKALDAGSGITPFGHVLAGLGWDVTACDFDRDLMTALDAADMARVYGSHVKYEWQDLTNISHPDATFDLVTCVSVVEHIGAPLDQRAVAELCRVLKPNGQLILTVDYEPPFRRGPNEPRRIARRVGGFLRRGDLAGLVSSVSRGLRARQAAAAGSAKHARTPNQCFQISHLLDDIEPILSEGLTPLDVPFARALDAVTAEDVPGFWNLVPGLFDLQSRRLVLPAVARYVKPH